MDHAIALQARYGEMPLVSMIADLARKTGSAAFRSDGNAEDAAKTFHFSDEKLKIRVKKDGPLIKRPLYVETTFDLEG